MHLDFIYNLLIRHIYLYASFRCANKLNFYSQHNLQQSVVIRFYHFFSRLSKKTIYPDSHYNFAVTCNYKKNMRSFFVFTPHLEHPSGCSDGTSDGLAGYEEIQACKGKWISHVKRGIDIVIVMVNVTMLLIFSQFTGIKLQKK